MKYIKTQFQLTKVLLHSITHPNMSSSERLILTIISSHANPAHNWQAWPSIDSITRSSGLGKAGVHKVLKSLKEKGILSTLPGYTGRCSHYIIHIEKIADARYATQAELDKRKEKDTTKNSVDKPSPAVQQSSHRQGFSHPDYDDDEEYSPF